MSGFSTVALVGAGMGVNAAHAVVKKADPFPTLLAGSILMVVCAALGRLGMMLAALFLLSSLLTHGVVIVDLLSRLVS